MGRTAAAIELNAEKEAELKRWQPRLITSSALHLRAGIVLGCACDYSGEEIANFTIPEQTMTKWRRCFFLDRIAGLSDAPRSDSPAALLARTGD